MSKAHLSPLRYPGGKSRISEYLASLFEAQDPVGYLDLSVWFEPFAGGLGAGLKLLDAGVVEQVWFCEANPALAAFWRTISGEHAAELIRFLEQAAGEQITYAYYQQCLEVLADPAEAGEVALGAAAIVVNRCSRSGLINPKASPIGGKNQNGQYTVNSRWNLPRTIEQIRHIASYSDSLMYLGDDGISQISALSGSGVAEEVFIFADPPYVGAGNRLYQKGMDEQAHRDLASALLDCGAHWALAYDDAPLARELYAGYEIEPYLLRHTANKSKEGQELLIFGQDTIGAPVELGAAG